MTALAIFLGAVGVFCAGYVIGHGIGVGSSRAPDEEAGEL